LMSVIINVPNVVCHATGDLHAKAAALEHDTGSHCNA
jgi:hypothetical protein